MAEITVNPTGAYRIWLFLCLDLKRIRTGLNHNSLPKIQVEFHWGPKAPSRVAVNGAPSGHLALMMVKPSDVTR